MKQVFKYIVLIVCACSCWACMDDGLDEGIDSGKPAQVKLSMDFSDLEVVTPGTRSAGDAIGKMSNVCVLFYKKDGTLAMDGANPICHYQTVSSSETVSVAKTVPAGAYKVVAVANMGNLATSADYRDKIQNLADLEAVSLQWNNTRIGANNQMFGFFTFSAGNNSIDDAIAKDGMSNVAPTNHDAPELILSGNKTLYAKLYRAVAKVSVAFNGEGLNSNVFVTIKSIRLGNLPAACPLWVENKNVTDTLSTGGTGAQSEVLTDADFGLLRVTNRGAGSESLFPKNAHSQTGPSLFMFENRQGTAPTSGHKDKTIAKKPYGAFIEIEAYYANESTGSNGKIIYRYMLGEDIPNKYDNYNLTRNRHYKVTLMLQKSGKEDPYWRVEYTEDPFVSLPTEVNISYRNSAKLDILFSAREVNGGVVGVSAKIIENPWFDDLIDGHRDATISGGALTDSQYGFLTWAGCQSSNSGYGTNKTSSIPVTKENDQYKLSVQTEALGFRTSTGEADSFTGYNNYSNPRSAKIQVTITYQSGATKTAEVKVVQVPRVVNPIAVYRKWDNDSPFNVRLLNASGAEIESYGPWKAEVESGADWIGIRREGTASYGSSIDSGDEGGAIRFDYRPLSTLNNEGQARCGVIVVRFSNYNVEHRIYVRQGYAPMAIGTSENRWTSFNYIGVDSNNQPQFTSSPMEEGAWLRPGNSVGILANNTDNTDGFENPPSSFKMSDGSNLPWSNIGMSSSLTAQFTAPGYELPTQADVFNLQALRENSGFGIGYDDNATRTVAFDEAEQYTNAAMGRRGFVICDPQGRNLFFPTGKRGYGRRRDYSYDDGYDFKGGLHYTHSRKQPNPYTRPALFGLPKAMGALYWANGTEKMSFNYSLSNIETANGNDNGVRYDACFARLMKASDIITFDKYYQLKAYIPVTPGDGAVLSISSWGEVTDAKIGDQAGLYANYQVSFKYNYKIDKAKSGVIIRASRYNGTMTFERKFSIQELEAINIGSEIDLPQK